MEKVEFLTSQNVLIEQEVAGVWDRIAAFLFDLMIIAAFLIISNYLFASIGINSAAFKRPFNLLLILYPLIMETFNNGQTLGKQQLKVKVVKTNGNQASFVDYLIRWLFLPIDLLFFGGIAIVMIWLRGKGQRLGDLVAGTAVVKKEKNTSTIQFQNLPTDYQPVFPEAIRLTTHDIEIINQTLVVFRESGNRLPLEKLNQKIKAHLQINSDLPPAKFLVTVIKDFNHLSRH